MKLRNMLLFVVMFVLLSTQMFSQNTNPVVENVSFTIVGSAVTITYDIKDANQTSVTIQMFVSENNGLNWTERTSEATGNVNTVTGITTTSAQKTIGWTYSSGNEATMKIKIIANDETADGSPCAGTEKVYYEGGPNDGNGDYYNTIQIADQCWLKENLNIGTMINSTTGGDNSDGEQTSNSNIEKYCYLNTETNCDTYGGLYQWNEAMQYVTTPGTKGICPDGWHIPTQYEFETLKYAVNDNGNTLRATNQSSGTNTSGFSIMLAGLRNHVDGSFFALGNTTDIWSSKDYGSTTDAYTMYISTSSGFFFFNNNKKYGFSIRCLKNP